jgi:hypothetical protein
VGEWVAILGGRGGYAIAWAIGLTAVLRFLKWLLPFVFDRLDVARGNLGKRLKHVELELEVTREALFMMLNRMAERYPADPVLVDVARILRRAWPAETPRFDPDSDLLNKLDRGEGNASAT